MPEGDSKNKRRPHVASEGQTRKYNFEKCRAKKLQRFSGTIPQISMVNSLSGLSLI